MHRLKIENYEMVRFVPLEKNEHVEWWSAFAKTVGSTYWNIVFKKSQGQLV